MAKKTSSKRGVPKVGKAWSVKGSIGTVGAPAKQNTKFAPQPSGRK